MTEKDELLQAKERELAEAQQQVSTYYVCDVTCINFLTAGD